MAEVALAVCYQGWALTRRKAQSLTYRFQGPGLPAGSTGCKWPSSSPQTPLMPHNLADLHTGHSKDDVARMKRGIHSSIQRFFCHFTLFRGNLLPESRRQKGWLIPRLPRARSQSQIPLGAKQTMEVRDGPRRAIAPGTSPNPYVEAAATQLCHSLACEELRVQRATPPTFSRETGDSGFSDEPSQMENFPI